MDEHTKQLLSSASYGFNIARGAYFHPDGSNFHVHFRTPDDPRFPIAIEETALLYRYCTAMPNLGGERLINTPEKAVRYREQILKVGRDFNKDFDVTVPFYVEPTTQPKVVKEGLRSGAWCSGKLYSKGATTQSAEGVDFREIRHLYPVFEVMEEEGGILLIHLEPMQHANGSEIDVFEREGEGVKILNQLLLDFPQLKIVFEHVSKAKGAAALRRWREEGRLVQCTVAPQYVRWNRNKLFSGGMNPRFFSIPALGTEEDRLALIELLWDCIGFLGTDSAPHLDSAKTKACGCAGGVFNEPTSLYTYFMMFKQEGDRRGADDWFDRFVAFACLRGPDFYKSAWKGISIPTSRVELRPEPWKVREYYNEGDPLVPMDAGETIPYRLCWC